jgi:hypothetical protein
MRAHICRRPRAVSQFHETLPDGGSLRAVATLTGFRTVKEGVGHVDLDGQRGVDAPRRQPTEQLGIPAERGPAAEPQSDGVAWNDEAKSTARGTCQSVRSTSLPGRSRTRPVRPTTVTTVHSHLRILDNILQAHQDRVARPVGDDDRLRVQHHHEAVVVALRRDEGQAGGVGRAELEEGAALHEANHLRIEVIQDLGRICTGEGSRRGCEGISALLNPLLTDG